MGDAKQSSRNRMLMIASAVIAVFLIGMLITTIAGNPPRATRASTAKTDVTQKAGPAKPAGSTGERAGMPVGFAHDDDGAVDAAVAYATASQRWLYFTDDQIRDAIEEIATPQAAARLTQEVVDDVSVARKQLGASSGRVWWIVRPLAWDVEFRQGNQARVSVWVVTVLSAAEVAAPQSEWMTVTVDLAWVDGDWHVDAVRDSPGPTPVTGPKDRPWDAEPFDEALKGFTRIDGEPVQ